MRFEKIRKISFKILIPLVILIGILSLVEIGFIIDSNNTKSKNALEIAQTFVHFLENKQFYRANHLMCFGEASLDFWHMYLHLMSYSERNNLKNNNEKLAFELTKREYKNKNIPNNSKNPNSGLIYSLKIYPQSKNPDNYSNSFGFAIGNGQNSTCIFLQAG